MLTPDAARRQGMLARRILYGQSNERRPIGEDSLTLKFKMSRLDRGGCTWTARLLIWAGRYLLILSALSILTMPITEHFWSWDRFLETGRDFELGTLLVLMLLCLVLVLSKQRKQCDESLRSRSSALEFQFADGNAPVTCRMIEGSVFDRELGSNTQAGMCTSPLQI